MLVKLIGVILEPTIRQLPQLLLMRSWKYSYYFYWCFSTKVVIVLDQYLYYWNLLVLKIYLSVIFCFFRLFCIYAKGLPAFCFLSISPFSLGSIGAFNTVWFLFFIREGFKLIVQGCWDGTLDRVVPNVYVSPVLGAK